MGYNYKYPHISSSHFAPKWFCYKFIIPVKKYCKIFFDFLELAVEFQRITFLKKIY